jgi:hypothetical protein
MGAKAPAHAAQRLAVSSAGIVVAGQYEMPVQPELAIAGYRLASRHCPSPQPLVNPGTTSGCQANLVPPFGQLLKRR